MVRWCIYKIYLLLYRENTAVRESKARREACFDCGGLERELIARPFAFLTPAQSLLNISECLTLLWSIGKSRAWADHTECIVVCRGPVDGVIRHSFSLSNLKCHVFGYILWPELTVTITGLCWLIRKRFWGPEMQQKGKRFISSS